MDFQPTYIQYVLRCTRKSNEDMERSAKQRESNQLKIFISVQSVVSIYFSKVYEASREIHVP